MKYEWLDERCLSKTGAVKDFKMEWNATRYMVGGKMFALLGEDNEGRSIVTLKGDPAFAEILRRQHKDIIPGYYMNKMHWNSVYLNGDTPDDILAAMVYESHSLVFRALSKKAQKEISEQSN